MPKIEGGDLTSYLTQVDRMISRHHEGRPSREDWTHGSYEGLVLAHGQCWPGDSARVDRHGEYKMCFSNAAFASSLHGWDYVEGYAWQGGLVPVLHAWCVDEGTVVETTWERAADVYHGIVIPWGELLLSQLETEHHGVIANDWMRGAVLLKDGPSWLAEDGD